MGRTESRLLIIRLRDTYRDDYYRGRRLIESFSCDDDYPQERFLKDRAIDMERNGSARTYLFYDVPLGRTVGYFTVSAGVKCAYDRPVFDIMRLSAGNGGRRDLERHMISAAVGMFEGCERYLGHFTVTAECSDRLLKTYEELGFSYVGRSVGGFNRIVMER